MIARVWTAEARKANAPEYAAFFQSVVLKELRSIAGFRGAQLLQRTDRGKTHISVITFWRSMKAVESFAGVPSNRARIEPAARRLLLRHDTRVRHFEVRSFAALATRKAAAGA